MHTFHITLTLIDNEGVASTPVFSVPDDTDTLDGAVGFKLAA